MDKGKVVEAMLHAIIAVVQKDKNAHVLLYPSDLEPVLDAAIAEIKRQGGQVLRGDRPVGYIACFDEPWDKETER